MKEGAGKVLFLDTKKSTLPDSHAVVSALVPAIVAAGTPFHISTPFMSHSIGMWPQKHPKFQTHYFIQSTGTSPSNRAHSFPAHSHTRYSLVP